MLCPLCPALLFAKISFTIIWRRVLPNMRHIIIRYLVQELKKGMIHYEVNGTPEKRMFRIHSLAAYQYTKLTKIKKYKLFIKILFKIILNK
jgi:hypothetical protein